MRLALLLLACALACPAQVQVSLSIVPNAAARRLLNKRAANLVSPWVGTARNAGPERVLLTESAILGQIAALQPFDRAAMAILIQDAGANSLWARLGRGGQDATALGAWIAAQRAWGSPWGEVLTGVAWAGPYIVGRFKGVERPVGASYEGLAAGWPLSLDAGQGGSFHVFTVRWPDNSPPVAFALPAGGSLVRMIQ